jgi:PIN domain nuclease of toxin-antitoxin system
VRAIIDTHALIWAVDDPEHLGTEALLRVISDSANEILFSAGSIWELGIKIGLGKLTLSLPFRAWMEQAASDLRLTILPITIECAAVQSTLESHHRDPFDRMLVAHTLVESVPLLSLTRCLIVMASPGFGRLSHSALTKSY